MSIRCGDMRLGSLCRIQRISLVRILATGIWSVCTTYVVSTPSPAHTNTSLASCVGSFCLSSIPIPTSEQTRFKRLNTLLCLHALFGYPSYSPVGHGARHLGGGSSAVARGRNVWRSAMKFLGYGCLLQLDLQCKPARR